MDDPTELVVADEVAGDIGDKLGDDVAGDVEEELLVEEISIDGMCGVY
jgi:mycofactocin precursor